MRSTVVSGSHKGSSISLQVTQPSTSGAVALAQHLSRVGARMYGAFWCSHCAEQKELFGAQAARVLPYEECFPTGYRKGVTMADACAAQHLEGFPTWVFPDGTKVRALLGCVSHKSFGRHSKPTLSSRLSWKATSRWRS